MTPGPLALSHLCATGAHTACPGWWQSPRVVPAFGGCSCDCAHVAGRDRGLEVWPRIS